MLLKMYTWRSKSYFRHVTPGPGSDMLLQSVTADILPKILPCLNSNNAQFLIISWYSSRYCISKQTDIRLVIIMNSLARGGSVHWDIENIRCVQWWICCGVGGRGGQIPLTKYWHPHLDAKEKHRVVKSDPPFQHKLVVLVQNNNNRVELRLVE